MLVETMISKLTREDKIPNFCLEKARARFLAQHDKKSLFWSSFFATLIIQL